MSFRNPIIWLARFPYRRGYGVHSPFAYGFTTQVLYSPGQYYAFEELEDQFSWWEQLLPVRDKAICKLLFRLANFRQPANVWAPDASAREQAFLHRGCQRAVFCSDGSQGVSDLVFLHVLADDVLERVGEHSMLVVGDLQDNKEEWQRLKQNERVRVTFDLYDVGIAFFNPKLQRHNYMVNW